MDSLFDSQKVRFGNVLFMRSSLLRVFMLFILPYAIACNLTAKLLASETIEISSALLTIVESAEVSAARAGILAKVYVREGELVEAGQLVAELDHAKATAAVKEAMLELRMATQDSEDDIDVRYAQKTLQQALNELERSEGVNRELPNTIPARELEFLRLAAERAELEIERAEREHSLAMLRVDLKRSAVLMSKLELAEHQFQSPIIGMVVRVEKQRGEWVEPGDSILRIVRIDRVRAEGLLKAELAQMELIGRPAQLLVKAPGDLTIQVKGKVTFVSPEANPVNAMVRVWAEFDRGNSTLRPGLQGVIRISGPVDEN